MKEKKEIKPNGYWKNYDNCYNEAKKYKTRSEFMVKASGAYRKAKDNGWLKDYTWFIEKHKPNGYWTYERCKEEALKYTSKSEFNKGSKSAYSVAWENGWLDDYTWFKRPEAYNKKWTYEACYEEALKYTSKSEFKYGNGSAYAAARKNKWINDYPWLKRQRHDGYDYWIYVYEDAENKVVYVGLTYRKARHREHMRDKTDTARLYFESIGKPFPKQIVKMTDLSPDDAQYYENWYKLAYSADGWRVLNIGKTGVGTGSLGSRFIKWTYEACYQEALKYESSGDFAKGNGSAYDTARKQGWLKDYAWFVEKCKRDYWNKETCLEAAKDCSTMMQFITEYGRAYQMAKKEGWIKDYTWLETRLIWTRETCYEEALKYNSKKEFVEGSNGAYQAAAKNGWFVDYTWFKVLRRENWNYDTCKEEAKKYTNQHRFKVGSAGAYHFAWRHGLLKEFFPKVA